MTGMNDFRNGIGLEVYSSRIIMKSLSAEYELNVNMNMNTKIWLKRGGIITIIRKIAKVLMKKNRK